MLRSIQGMRMALKRLEQQKAATGPGGPLPAGAAAHGAHDSTVVDKQAALQAQASRTACGTQSVDKSCACEHWAGISDCHAHSVHLLTCYWPSRPDCRWSCCGMLLSRRTLSCSACQSQGRCRLLRVAAAGAAHRPLQPWRPPVCLQVPPPAVQGQLQMRVLAQPPGWCAA